MKPAHATTDIFGHQPKTKELPPLEFDLRGFQAIEQHIREHLPSAPRAQVLETIPGETNHVDNKRTEPDQS